jgi:archaemetzincin
MPYIYIQPIKTDHLPWIEELEKSVFSVFGYHTKVGSLNIDLVKTFDPTRQQYNSSQILLQIISRPPTDAVKVLGVVNVDLFIPILTFVFGEAQLRGIGSVIALQRLNNKFYGLSEDRKLLGERLVKEAIHELGHNFGLIHCRNQSCVMKSSTYVEEVDQKSGEMCSRCQEILRGLMRSAG